MSLLSLVSAANSALLLSNLAAKAAEEVSTAAKTAAMHAKAALAAAELALDIERKVNQTEKYDNINSIDHKGLPVCQKHPFAEKILDLNCEMSEMIEEPMLSSISGHIINVEEFEKTNGNPMNKTCVSSSKSISQIEIDPVNGQVNNLCSNCKMPAQQCRHNTPLTHFTSQILGCKVKSSGSYWLAQTRGRTGRVWGSVLGDTSQVRVTWESSNQCLTYGLRSNVNGSGGEHLFTFHCQDSVVDDKSQEKESKCDPVYIVQRLPAQKKHEVWEHEKRQKHRIIFSVNEDIKLRGVGLLVNSPIQEIMINVSQKTRQGDFGTHYSEKFTNVGKSLNEEDSTPKLMFARGVPLQKSNEYLLVVSLTGGSSSVGIGGKDVIATRINDAAGDIESRNILFNFKTYRNWMDVEGKATNVEEGLVERLMFSMY